MLESHAQNITTRVIDLPRPLRRNVLSIDKDDDGFLWFRNSQGLWRFDGTNAQLFDKSKFKLKGNEVIQLFACFDHFLMLLDFNNKLCAYDQLNDTTYTFQFNNLQIYNFIHTNNNTLLFFNTAGQGYIFARKSLLQIGPDLTKLKGWKQGMHVYASAIDTGNNRLYLYMSSLIAYVKGDSLVAADSYNNKKVAVAYNFTTNNGFDITSRYLVINNPHGFMMYDKNTLKLLHLYYGMGLAGRIVEGDNLVFLARKKPSDFSRAMQSPLFSMAAPLFNGDFNIYGIVPSGYAGKYIMVGDKGLFELTFHRQINDTFYNRDLLAQYFSNKSIRGICRFSNHLYIGTYNGFYGYDGKSTKQLSPQLVYSIVAEDNQTLLLGIENINGLAEYNTVTEKTTLPFEGGRLDAIRCLYNYQGLCWGGADNGIYQFYKKNGIWNKNLWLFDTSLGAVRQIAVNSGYWYMATQNGFFALNEKKQLKKIYPQNGSTIIYAFTALNDGFLLATHGNGIVLVDKNGGILATYSQKEGLQGNYVYSLVKTGGLLVAGTSAGPSVFSIKDGKLKPVPQGEEDNNSGIFDQECNHGAFFEDTIGRQVILGGLQGLMFIDEDYYTAHANAKPGRVLLSYIKLVGDISRPATVNLFGYCSPAITVPANQSYISLKFASPLNFSRSEGLMRIRGISDTWQSFNLSDEVNLINLPPGKYTLEARLGESLDEQYWFVKTLVVLPAFYQTLWFEGAVLLTCALLATGLVYLFWRSKVRKLKAEQHLRTTIASDLHDDIGSTLNSISVYTEIAGQQLQTDAAKAKILLDKMGMASRGMIDTMNDIVWTINPKNDDFENVLKRMQFFAGELLSGKNILLDFKLDEKVKKLKFTMQERKNIYLLYKEAINNIYKYSAATKVTVNIAKEGAFLVLTVTDNGKGFNALDKKDTGNGLANMKNRAKEIGGTMVINSAAGKGTQVFLRLRHA